MKAFCTASLEEKFLPRKKNGSPLEQGLANMEGDEWFLIAVPVELKRDLVLYEVSRYHGVIMVKIDS